MDDDREVVLERFAVKVKSKGKWHYIAAHTVNNFSAVCGCFIPPSPWEHPLIELKDPEQPKPLDHNVICASCKKIIEKHANAGRVVRLAKTNEGRGDAMIFADA